MGLGQIPSSGGGGGAPPVADTTLKRLALTPDALSGSSALSSLSIAQTWNTSGSPTALLVNITNTASGASAKLLDLQTGGASRFYVSKLGDCNAAGSFQSQGGLYLGMNGSWAAQSVSLSATAMDVLSGWKLRWCNGTSGYHGSATLTLCQGAAATLQIGENHATAPVAQFLQGAAATTGTVTGGELTVRSGAGSGGASRGQLNLIGGVVAIQSADSGYIQIDGLMLGKYVTSSNQGSLSPSKGVQALCEKDTAENWVPGYWDGAQWVDMTGTAITFYTAP